MLLQSRQALKQAGVTPETAPAAFQAAYVAEGSDWFWWFGEDQDSGNDEEFDDLFRVHLKNIYSSLGIDPPPDLEEHIVPHKVVWTFTQPVGQIQPRDRLTVLTNCPGTLTWRTDGGSPQSAPLNPVGGVMAGAQRYQLSLGPFSPQANELRLSFLCTHVDCDGKDICCRQDEYLLLIQ